MVGSGDQGASSSRCLADRSDAPRCVLMTRNPQDLETILQEMKTDHSALMRLRLWPSADWGLQMELSHIIGQEHGASCSPEVPDGNICIN